MSNSLSPTVLASRVQHLLDERQQHEEAIQKIDKTLADISSLLGTGPAKAGRKPATQPGIAAAPSPSAAKPRRKQREFAVTGEQSILAFIKLKRNPTTRQINANWVREGRRGSAANLLSKLVKEKMLKRKPLGGKLGSEYSVP
jgi:hypothetical protein